VCRAFICSGALNISSSLAIPTILSFSLQDKVLLSAAMYNFVEFLRITRLCLFWAATTLVVNLRTTLSWHLFIGCSRCATLFFHDFSKPLPLSVVVLRFQS
jgi:branched-subunit amino acid transport protein